MDSDNSNQTRVGTQGIQNGRSINKKTHWKKLPYNDWTSPLWPLSLPPEKKQTVASSPNFPCRALLSGSLPVSVWLPSLYLHLPLLSFCPRIPIPHFCMGLMDSSELLKYINPCILPREIGFRLKGWLWSEHLCSLKFIC